ncbi:MAG: histidine kinase dimerization/phospho-acceptor domain-containing protein, partial [bacterium]|nr:histidine kinase dimerization/phospho-acceptor domain-containing protein [bacterium]
MNGIYNLYIPICGLLIALICNFVFFSKTRAKNKETEIFSRELIYSLVDSIVMVAIILLALIKPENIKILEFLNKIDYAMYILFSSNLFLYVYYVTSQDDENKKTKLYNLFFWITTIFDIILMLLLLFMKVNVHISTNALYSDGMALNTTIIGCAIYFIAIMICLFLNIKKAITKKLTPLYILILFFILVVVLNQIDKTIVIISAVLAFVNLIMLFTIENPDMKMIEQLEAARDQADKANRAKTDFLSSMSHEIRTPLNAIVGFSDCINHATSLEEAKENANDVINASNTLLEIVNGILDISKIEAGKLEIVNSKYNAKNTFEELAKLITPKMQEKGLDFSYYIAPDLPTTLYGDHSNIKKVITNLLSNAAKYTDKGFVRYEVNCINTNN